MSYVREHKFNFKPAPKELKNRIEGELDSSGLGEGPVVGSY
jgi:hypothetical protein